MKRYKWFQIGLPAGFQSFTKRIQNIPLTRGGHFGFSLIESEKGGRPRFRHLARSRVSIFTMDADGGSEHRLVETVESVEFEAFQSGDRTWLRVDDPPRSLRQFFD